MSHPEERRFPIQTGKHGAGRGWIPWSVAERAYADYSARYGRSQSLERVAERGGFHEGEMDLFAPGWREEASEITALRKELAEAQAAREALTVQLEKTGRAYHHEMHVVGMPHRTFENCTSPVCEEARVVAGRAPGGRPIGETR